MANAHGATGSDAGRSSSSGTSRSLLQRLRSNDAEAWDRLVALYGPMVLHWCRRLQLREQDIGDVFQEVFQAVATHLAAFRKEGPRDTFRGWLRTITRSKAYDFYRQRQHEPDGVGGTEMQLRLAQVAAPAVLEEIARDDEEVERGLFSVGLESIRNEFEERTWQAFWQTAVQGRAAADVALDLRMSPGAVRVAKSRVLRRLREELGDLLDE